MRKGYHKPVLFILLSLTLYVGLDYQSQVSNVDLNVLKNIKPERDIRRIPSSTNKKISKNNRSVASVLKTKDFRDIDQELLENSLKPSSLKVNPDKYYDFEEGLEFARAVDLYAIKEDQFADSGLDPIDIQDRYHPYLIAYSDTAPAVEYLDIVKVKGSKKFGVFTGVIKIKLDNYDDATSLLKDTPYEITQEYAHINTIFYKFESYEKTIEAYRTLEKLKTTKIDSLKIEILQFRRTSR